jgi:hypothetical protein
MGLGAEGARERGRGRRGGGREHFLCLELQVTWAPLECLVGYKRAGGGGRPPTLAVGQPLSQVRGAQGPGGEAGPRPFPGPRPGGRPAKGAPLPGRRAQPPLPKIWRLAPSPRGAGRGAGRGPSGNPGESRRGASAAFGRPGRAGRKLEKVSAHKHNPKKKEKAKAYR